MPDSDNAKIAFFGIELFENGSAIRGAVLITDLDTKPFEFRITSPVRPSLIQRVLYGTTMEDYIHVDLMGVPLFQATHEKVDLIIVARPNLLRIRTKLTIPVVLLRPEQNTDKEDPSNNQSDIPRTITITSHREFQADTPYAQSLLSPTMQKRDLLEPFERLKVALTEAHKQKVGESPSKT